MIINFKKLLKSFGYAFAGLRFAFSEQTFRIFCLAAAAVIFFMFWFKISLFEKVILILTITLVMTLELINSRIERVLDFLQPDHDPRIKVIKDISAGAVFLACLGALAIGILIFWPYLVK
ncbi:MAG: diacylglycerol kinase [Candidatus Nealsonbacteria bacterium]|nr:MAG: diacylglycerol kinase [Candidatus Nealsonbacteria bacterium]